MKEPKDYTLLEVKEGLQPLVDALAQCGLEVNLVVRKSPRDAEAVHVGKMETTEDMKDK
jgi:hypothetical protein